MGHFLSLTFELYARKKLAIIGLGNRIANHHNDANDDDPLYRLSFDYIYARWQLLESLGAGGRGGSLGWTVGGV